MVLANYSTKVGGNFRSRMIPRSLRSVVVYPCILGDPQYRGTKSVAASPLPSRGPKRGRKCYVTPAFSGIPNIGEQNMKWLPHPCHLRGPKRGRKCYVTPAFSGIPSAKSGEQNQKWYSTKGKKIRSGCLAPALSGSQKRAEMRCQPCILGGPRTGVQKGPSLDQWKKATQSGGQDHKWPTSGPKILRPSSFVFGGSETWLKKKLFFLLGSET